MFKILFGRKLDELYEELERKDKNIKQLEKDIRNAEKELIGDRCYGTHCLYCENMYPVGSIFNPIKGCLLNTKCKDFKKNVDKNNES